MKPQPERQFTAAARRVLEEAARWSGGSNSAGLTAPSLLLALLAEAECRAAIVLARHGITPADVRAEWPDLAPSESPAPSGRLSADVEESISAAVARLHEYPQPLDLATEHLLLGLAAADHATGCWLRSKGIDPAALELEIHRQYGHTAGPLPVEAAEPLEVPPDAQLDRVLEEAAAEVRRGSPDPAGVVRGVATSGDLATTRGGRREPATPTARPSDEIRVLRILDAAANRGREGLRVVEDYVRFVLDDRHLTERLKGLRHELTALVGRVPLGDRLAARETQADVGTGLSTDAERRRDDTFGVLAANFTRLQEALRSLEEFGKLVDVELAGRFESLRYQSYTLQRAVEITETSGKRLAAARLYVLVDGGPSAEEFERLAWSLVEAGVGVLQLRDKWLDDRQLYERARLLRQITRGSDTLFIMNDRPDLAVLVHADGVHVGQEELSVKDARTIVGPAALVGVSTHSIEQARRAVLDGANYIGVGPTFPSETKEFDQFPGLPLLEAVAEEIRLPAFAIGGITPKNLPQVLAAGFTRVAVSRAVTAATDPPAVVRTLLTSLSHRR